MTYRFNSRRLWPIVSHSRTSSAAAILRRPSHECCLRLDAVSKDFPVERQCAGGRAEGRCPHVRYPPALYIPRAWSQRLTEKRDEPVEEVDMVLDVPVPGGE